MRDNGRNLRTILGEEQIVLLNRVTQLAEMAEEAFSKCGASPARAHTALPPNSSSTGTS